MMNPDTGNFEELKTELLDEYEEKWKSHGIKQQQIFRVGEVVELKGANYRVKSIHSRSIVLQPAYPPGDSNG